MVKVLLGLYLFTGWAMLLAFVYKHEEEIKVSSALATLFLSFAWPVLLVMYIVEEYGDITIIKKKLK